LITSYVTTKNADEQFTNFGAGGALVFELLTWVLAALLVRETEGPKRIGDRQRTPLARRWRGPY
jgi:hypothetical protein